MHKLFNLVKSFFKDKNGEWAVIAFPNGLLLSWIVLVVLGMFVHDSELKDNLGRLSGAVIFAWAYLEITRGESYFRRALGAGVLLGLILSFFT